MRIIIHILFFLSFIYSAFNIVNYLGMFYSETISRLMAYVNLIVVIGGGILCLQYKERDRFPKLLVLWYYFFLLYYGIGMIANVVHGFEAPYLKTLVPIFYFVSFSFYLGLEENRNVFGKMVIVSFTIANLFLIYFQKINFSLDHGGVTDYTLDRAGGLFGDANNAAVMCLLSFIFIEHLFRATTKVQKLLKLLCILIAVYALILTFSKTGFLVLLIVGALLYQRFITPGRILLLIIAIPLSLYFIIQAALSSPSLSAVQKSRISDVINILTLNTSEVSYSNRDVLLENMLGYVQQNPLWGNGVYFSTHIKGHNTIVGVWADAGVFVFIFFLFVLAAFLFRSMLIKNKRLKFFILASLMVLNIFMMTLQTIINQAYLLVLFVYFSYLISKDLQEDDGVTGQNLEAQSG